VVPEQSLRIKAVPAIFPFGKNFPVWKKSTTAVFKALKEHQKVEQSMKKGGHIFGAAGVAWRRNPDSVDLELIRLIGAPGERGGAVGNSREDE
jgi:hypothetical protein